MATDGARVVLVVPVFPKLSETFVVRHFLGLLDRGWEVFVLCDRSPDEAWQLFPQLDRPELRRRVRTFSPTRPRLRTLAAAPLLLGCLLRRPRFTFRSLRRGLRQLYLDAAPALLRPDLVHFEFGTLAVGRAGLGERLGCPIAVSFRGYDLNFAGLGEAGFYDPVWQEAAAIHVLGEDLRRRALRRGCPPDLPCRMIPPAVDAGRFLERGGERQPGPLRILSVGRLEWKKGYEDALVALELLCRRGVDFRWRLIGDGDQLEAIAFARHQLELEDRVELALSLPPSAIAEEMAAADLFLHPAISEGFCNAVLEAQAAGLPVVCSDADGLAENVLDGVTGLVVPRRDPAALAAAIEELAADPERRKRMGAAGRERAARVFPPAAEIDGFEAFYRDILASWKERCGSTS
jgi:colanic acid/amylovoran biosynthesis glycosyltransferase